MDCRLAQPATTMATGSMAAIGPHRIGSTATGCPGAPPPSILRNPQQFAIGWFSHSERGSALARSSRGHGPGRPIPERVTTWPGEASSRLLAKCQAVRKGICRPHHQRSEFWRGLPDLRSQFSPARLPWPGSLARPLARRSAKHPALHC